MSESGGSANGEPHLFQTLKNDLGRIFADVRRRGVKREIGGTLADLEAFYLSAETKKRLARMRPVRRVLHRLWWLVKSLLMKLTPARRVLLALSLILIASGLERVEFDAFRFSFRFSIVGVVLLFLVLMLELKDKQLARDELEAGRKVQLALMPARSPRVPGWDLWLYTEPANDVGGDLVDHLQIDAQHHGVALADVAGKALPAALLMAKLLATLRALVPQVGTLSELGAAVNHILQRDGLPNRFATLVYLVLTSDAGQVRVLNAGHMPPLVVRGRTVEELPRGSVALGIVADATFPEQRVDLAEGDVLAVYSDGITEAMNPTGEFFGEDKLRALLRETAGQPVDAVGARILSALEAFVAGAHAHDDVSLVVVKRQTKAA
jgi:phosphoserine phosphatase RsbU/P